MENDISLRRTYGIVTDAETWYFIQCDKKDDGTIKYHLSRPPLKINLQDYTVDKVRDILGHILWLLGKMEEAEAKLGIRWNNAPDTVDELSSRRR